MSTTVRILMADDDADDRMMVEQALRQSFVPGTSRFELNLIFVEDGQELMDYLRRKGKFADAAQFPLPDLILLDLNMPRKDGREALAEIKASPSLRLIPVVILTTSRAEEDILRCYALGANSFITKPASFQQLTEAMRILSVYWFELVKLPSGASA